MPRSKAWLHFIKIDANAARCNICKKDIAAKAGNTTNLLKHLMVHGINLRAESCSVFDKSGPHPSSSVDVAEPKWPPSTSSAPPDPASSGISKVAPDHVHLDQRTTRAVSVNPFTLAEKGKMTKEKQVECHRAVTNFVVKGLLPFSTVEAPWWREMIRALNPRYQPPSRDMLSNTLIPAWYAVEKGNVKRELQDVRDVAVTADGWTSVAQDHYLTVSVHYVREGAMKEKILHTRAVYTSQTGPVIAEEIGDILDEFKIKEKVVAITVDNAANMDVAVKKMSIRKIGCFAHTLNIAAQKLYTIPTVSRWAGRIRAMVVWLKRSSLAKPVLKEKQRLLGLPEHAVILDVKNRWNSLFLMVERFLEQFPAIQAASMDPRLKKSMEKDRLERLSDEDYRKAEQFVGVMKILYTSTICISSERSPTLGQILPILGKLQHHFTVTDEDSSFIQSIKETIWDNLSKRYQDESIRQFLEEGTALDPRFKMKVADGVWTRLEEELMSRISQKNKGVMTQAQQMEQNLEETAGDHVDDLSDEDCTAAGATMKKPKLSALEELFADEDMAVEIRQENTLSTAEKVQGEIQEYRGLPSTLTSVNPVTWWWNVRDTLPMLSNLATRYLCVQASSTPSERTFSTAGDTISQERACLLPEKADMLIFLKKNC
ncbi:zinc finger BED domain-containing protein 1-like [Notolabrus celidotus]|uniref:zinc finger BED domain-containing protein 1-like n=1 Tax=Notolabrus celidotus TaxID=1203425 RepID=UPI00148FEA3D|nr:zinc finger BED domain-containing protein 1-like [Notolabrus celidotus]